MSDFLVDMAKLSAERAAAAQPVSSSELDSSVVPLSLDGFDIIAEIKQRSPAEGALAEAGADTHDRVGRAQSYADGGAAAISVLTEPARFDGSLEHLAEISAALPTTPVMRKDFLVDPIQILEARKAGASGVLLITAMLDDRVLRSMLDCAFEHDLFVLLEAFDEEDLERARQLPSSDFDHAESGKLLFGVNTRNLRTLHVDPDRLEQLAASLPNGLAVAESGLVQAEDAARVAGLGYRLGLVGTALMRSGDPAKLIGEMRAAGSEVLAA